MPQLIKVIKTKDTCGMSALMLLILTVGDFFFVLNGIGILANKDMAQADRISSGLPLLLANGIALAITLILLFMKLNSVR
ncbi:MAG: PQ-loop domain-containing transporter [Mycoplasmoidaceae bacterium]|nr:PQ-loop domain-containing transporter [Mycoplasmoidaceae bacterium]